LAMIQNFNQTVFGVELFSPTLTFDILLRLGTLLAIIFVFFSDIKRLFKELLLCIKEIWHKKFSFQTNRPYRQLLYMLTVTTLFLMPAVYLIEQMETHFSKLSIIAFTLILTGVCNLFLDSVGMKKRKTSPSSEEGSELDDTESSDSKRSVMLSSINAKGGKDLIRKGAVVGVCQLVSVIPGLSRCSLTVMGGLLAGFRRDFTVKYAFLAAIPVLFVKIVLQTVTVLQDGIVINWLPYLIGMLAAFVSGVFFISVMRKAIRRNWCKRFGIYCMLLGILIMMIQLRG